MNTEDKLSQILQDLAVVKNQLNDLTKLKEDVDELKEKVIALEIKNVDQQKEIDELREEKKYYTRWAITAIGGAIVSALLAVLQFII